LAIGKSRGKRWLDPGDDLALNEDPLRIITLTPSALLKRKGKKESEWDEVSISDAATANQQGGICILLIDLGWAARDAGTLGQH
jgi:hypothetical protein